jgi:uncharacterized protein (TIGR01244 family)
MAEFRRLSDDVLAAPQLAPEDFQRAADAGVTLVINNRREGEAPDQIPGDEARALAEAAGLAYVQIPVSMGTLSLADVDAMAQALEGAEGLALAYCLSGARSAALWALAQAKSGGARAEDLLNATRAAGYDLEGLRPVLQGLAAQP